MLAIKIASLRAVHGNDLADNVSYCELADEAGARLPWHAHGPSSHAMGMGLTKFRVTDGDALKACVAEKANPKRLRKTNTESPNLLKERLTAPT
ncbi:MAG: hypothetical protein U0894_00790 [Pirellulales bacterium]